MKWNGVRKGDGINRTVLPAPRSFGTVSIEEAPLAQHPPVLVASQRHQGAPRSSRNPTGPAAPRRLGPRRLNPRGSSKPTWSRCPSEPRSPGGQSSYSKTSAPSIEVASSRSTGIHPPPVAGGGLPGAFARPGREGAAPGFLSVPPNLPKRPRLFRRLLLRCGGIPRRGRVSLLRAFSSPRFFSRVPGPRSRNAGESQFGMSGCSFRSMVSEVRFSTRQFPTLEQFSKGVIHTHHIKIRLPLEGSPYC